MTEKMRGRILVMPMSIPVIMEYDPSEPFGHVAAKWEEFCREVLAQHLDRLYEGVEIQVAPQ